MILNIRNYFSDILYSDGYGYDFLFLCATTLSDYEIATTLSYYESATTLSDYESHVLGEVEEKESESGGKGRCILNEINKVIFIEQFWWH